MKDWLSQAEPGEERSAICGPLWNGGPCRRSGAVPSCLALTPPRAGTMSLQFFSIPALHPAQKQGNLNQFIARHAVVAMPLRDGQAPGSRPAQQPTRAQIAYRAALNETDFTDAAWRELCEERWHRGVRTPRIPLRCIRATTFDRGAKAPVALVGATDVAREVPPAAPRQNNLAGHLFRMPQP